MVSNAARTPFEACLETAGRFGQRPFLCTPGTTAAGDTTGASWTYAAAAREIASLQACYAASGLVPDDRVAVVAEGGTELYLHLLALNGLGMSLVPLNLDGSDAEIDYQLRHSDSKLLVTPPAALDRLGQITREHGVCRVVTRDELAARSVTRVQPIEGDARREAALLYTSGTTGRPKGCMLSNEYFLVMGRWYNGLDGYCVLDSNDRLLTPLPPTHMNALCVSFMAMLMCGGCVVQLDRFHPSTWWQTVRSERATIVHYLGVMPAILLSLEEAADEDFSGQVKFGFGAGADPRHHSRFEERFGFPLLEAWAMTETGAGAAIIANREPRHVGQRCFGRAPPEVDYRIVDEDDGDVATGDPGELLVRRKGPDSRRGFFSGYYKDDDATNEAWRDDWLHTGDVVRQGPDGSLFFVDRRKNIIRRSGENISAAEVEATLLSHTEVDNCAVTAVPDPLRGDEVFAFIVAATGSPTNEVAAEHLVEHCLERLSYYKVPAYIAFLDQLPLTASQKVNRKDLRSAACKRLADATCFDLRNRKKRARKTG